MKEKENKGVGVPLQIRELKSEYGEGFGVLQVRELKSKYGVGFGVHLEISGMKNKDVAKRESIILQLRLKRMGNSI